MPLFLQKSFRLKYLWLGGLVCAGLAGLFLVGTPGEVSTPSAPEADQVAGDYSEHVHVDEFSGDLSLSIPLLQVPGRGGLDWDITLGYKAGVGLEQQASEVGLGWALNTPRVSRTINGIPDDEDTATNNYRVYHHAPATYPISQFNNQRRALKVARQKAQKQMLTNAVVGLAITAATGGFGAAAWASGAAAAGLASTALHTGYSLSQSNGQFDSSFSSMHLDYAMNKLLLESLDQQFQEMPASGKIYCAGCGDIDVGDASGAFDYTQADTYLVQSPSYNGSLLLLDQADNPDTQLLWPTSYQSASPVIAGDPSDSASTDFCAVTESLPYCGDDGDEQLCGGFFLTCTENNLVGLIDKNHGGVGGPFKGFMVIGPDGHRYLFNEPTATLVADDMPGFLGAEIPVSAKPVGNWSSFSWSDHYPGGQNGSDYYELQNDGTGVRYGSAEVLRMESALGWGISSIQDANGAILSTPVKPQGNRIDFEYTDLGDLDCYGDDGSVLTFSNSNRSVVGDTYFSVDEDYTATSSGHKTVSRSFEQRKVLSSVKTGTHRADFIYDCSTRYDGKEAFALSSLGGMPRLVRIVLFGVQDGADYAISKVELEHDHSLMPGAPDNANAASCAGAPKDCGRLTLLSIASYHCAGFDCSSDTEDGWAPVEETVFHYGGSVDKGAPAASESALSALSNGLCERSPQEVNFTVSCTDPDDEDENTTKYCNGAGSDGNTCTSQSDCCAYTTHESQWDAGSSRCVHTYFAGGTGERLASCLHPGAESWALDVADLEGDLNPPYIRDAQDRWGYFHYTQSQADLHHPSGAANPWVGAWSLSGVTWPSGARSDWSFEEDRFDYVNNFNLSSLHYGGGLRVSGLMHCDGFSQGCQQTTYAYVDCPIGDASCGASSGVALGLPNRSLYAADYAQLGELVESTPNESALFQANRFDVHYDKVVRYESDLTTGFTMTDYTSSKEDKDEDGVYENAGKGKWTPGKMFAFHEFTTHGITSSSAGHGPSTTHPGYVGFESVEFVPRKGEELWDSLKFRDGGKSFVMASEPGYLFWVAYDAGQSDATGIGDTINGCATHVALQHDASVIPFIGEPCPGYEAGEPGAAYCGEVAFADVDVVGWDFAHGDQEGNDGEDCVEPGEILFFCPAPNGIVAQATGESMDPRDDGEAWVGECSDDYGSDGEYCTGVAGKFFTPLVCDPDDELGEDDGHCSDEQSDYHKFMPLLSAWGEHCYPIFGGSAPDEGTDYQTMLATSQGLEWSQEAPTCLDVDPVDGDCDFYQRRESLVLGKEIRSYRLGLVQSVQHYKASDWVTPVQAEFNNHSFNDDERLEPLGIFLGRARLESKSVLSDGHALDIAYDHFDIWTGQPRTVTTRTFADSGPLEKTETFSFAYRSHNSTHKDFKPSRLHMLTLPEMEMVAVDGTTVSRTDYLYKGDASNPWCGDEGDPFTTCDDSAQGAILLHMVKKATANDEDFRAQQVFVAYDKYFNPLIVEDGESNRTIYRYGDNDDPCGDESSSGEGNIFVRGSDLESSRVTCVENAYGHRTIFAYDSAYRVTGIQDANGSLSSYGYNALGRLSAVDLPDTDVVGVDIEYTYGLGEGAGFVQEMRYGAGSSVQASINFVDGFGRPLQKSLQIGDGTALVQNTYYDGRFLKAGESQAVEVSGENALDFHGGVYDMEAQSSVSTRIVYEDSPLARVVEEYPLGGHPNVSTTTSYGVEGNDRTQSVADDIQQQDGLATTTYQNGFGHAVKVVDAAGGETKFETDVLGQVLAIEDANGLDVARNHYNLRGELVAQCHRDRGWNGEEACDSWDCGCVEFVYDDAGNKTWQRDERGVEITYVYDALNRLEEIGYGVVAEASAEVQEAFGEVASILYFYDDSNGAGANGGDSCAYASPPVLDWECSVGDVNQDGRKDVLDFTLIGQCVSEGVGCDPCSMDVAGGGTVNTVDLSEMGQHILQSSPMAYETHYTLDTDGASLSTSYGYLCGVAQGDMRYSYAYDNRGRRILEKFEGPAGEHVQFFTYDNFDNVSGVYRDQEGGDFGLAQAFVYDAANRLSSVMIGGEESVFRYDAQGRLSDIDYGNGILQSYGYDALGRMNHTWLTGVNLDGDGFNEHYVYDNVGNLQSIANHLSDVAVSAVFGYDALYRLTGIDNSDNYYGLDEESLFADVTYAYDAVGNRQSRQVTGGQAFAELEDDCYRSSLYDGTEEYAYAANSNRLNGTSFEGCTYSYDASGNMVSVSGCLNGSSWEISYTVNHQIAGLVHVDGCNADIYTHTYAYDPLGRRVEKRVVDSSGEATVTHYVYDALGSPIKVVEDGVSVTEHYAVGGKLFAESSGSDFRYVHQDWLKSSRALSDASGTIVSRFNALPFGQAIEPSELRFRYATGKEYDSSGFYNFAARYYDPSIGRFTSVDPLWMDDSSRSSYIYARNNPLRFIDPDGRSWKDAIRRRKAAAVPGVQKMDEFFTGMGFSPAGDYILNMMGQESKWGYNRLGNYSLGLTQIDPVKYMDIVNWHQGGNAAKRLEKINAFLGQELGIANFNIFDIASTNAAGSKYTSINQELAKNPLVSATLTRMALSMDVYTPIPKTIDEQAHTWKERWNTYEGRGEPEEFLETYHIFSK